MSLMRIMGVNCDSNTAYVAVVEDGKVLKGLPERIDVPGGLEREDRLEAVVEDAGRVMDQVSAERVVVLRPEATYKATHGQFMSRIALETLVRIAATRRRIPLDMVPRPTVRAALKLPRKGKLDSFLTEVFEESVGGHWTTGRGLAAIVALASEKS